MGLNKSILLGIILLLNSNLLLSQSNKKGIIKIKKSNCFDVNIGLTFCDSCRKDTLTMFQFNKAEGIIGHIASCNEDHVYNIISFDMEVIGKWKRHLNGPMFKTDDRNIVDKETKIIFTNCLVSVTSLNKKDSTVMANDKTFYIVSNK